jgi:hypothetical protein
VLYGPKDASKAATFMCFFILEQLQQFGKQLCIHLILTKQEKLTSNSLVNKLVKTHLRTRIYARADRD